MRPSIPSLANSWTHDAAQSRDVVVTWLLQTETGTKTQGSKTETSKFEFSRHLENYISGPETYHHPSYVL